MKRHWTEYTTAWTSGPISAWVHVPSAVEPAGRIPPLPGPTAGRGYVAYYVEIDGFTFHFASLDEIRACIDVLGKLLLPNTLRQAQERGIAPTQHWLRKMPDQTKPWRYRQKAVKYLAKVLADFRRQLDREAAGPSSAGKGTTMPRLSAGLLMYRIQDGSLQVLLAHPGGPFFRNKDDGAWSIPKGEPEPGEDLLLTAQREFEEETGVRPAGPFLPLRPIQQKGGKIVHAWAFQGDCDPAAIRSNTFTLEWPPKSGRQVEFPEIDRAAFFDLAAARVKIKAGQEALLDELRKLLDR